MLLCIALWYIEWRESSVLLIPKWPIFGAKFFVMDCSSFPRPSCNFTSVFTHPQGISGRTRKILLTFYAASCFFAVINWTPYFTGRLWHTPGDIMCKVALYTFFSSCNLSFAVTVSPILHNSGLHFADSYQRQRLKYFFLAIGVSFVLGGLNFLPMFGAGGLSFREHYRYHRTFHRGLFSRPTSPDGRKRLHGQRAGIYFISSPFLAVPLALAMIFLERYFFQRTDIILLFNHFPDWELL